MSQLLRTKSIDSLIEASQEEGHRLKRTLGPWSLMAFGVGAVIGSFALWYFASTGITYPEPVTIAGLTVTTLRAEFVPIVYWKSFLLVMATALLVSLPPAFRAARIKPVDALRSL